jgi:hypothetical protein
MSPPTPDRFRQAFNLVERAIEDRFHLPVRIADVPTPYTGDLDGREIVIDYDLEPEDALFILIHLFGHTVQWNTSARMRELGMLPIERAWSAAELLEITHYELRACQYSLRLLHDVGVTDLDQWVSDFAACDSAYLMHLYTTGQKRPFREFWQAGCPLLEAVEIPPFSPTCWRVRSAGVVV